MPSKCVAFSALSFSMAIATYGVLLWYFARYRLSLTGKTKLKA